MAEKKQPALRPDFKFLLAHPAHFIALGFGSGLPRKAPGTWGSLAAIPLYAALLYLMPPALIVALCVPVFVLGVWACEKTSQNLGVDDFGGIVIDEIVAMWLVLAVAPATWWGWLLAFALFRFFDIIKPWPIGWCDARLKGGLGVMVDDVVAALFAMILLWGVRALI